MSGRSRTVRGRRGAVVVAALLLLVGSALPLPARYNPDFGPYGPDKALHLVGHAGLAAVLVAAVGDDASVRAAVVAVAASTVYGLGTELFQEAIPGRAFEQGDVAAGFLGSIVGVLRVRRVAAVRRGRSGG